MILSILLKHTPIQRFGQCRSKNGDLRIAQKCSCAEHDEVRFRVHSKICIPKHLRVGDYPHVVRMWVWGFPHLYQLRRFPSCCAMLCGGGESTASYLSQASLLRSASRTGTHDAISLGEPLPSSRLMASPATTGISTNKPRAMINVAIETC